MPLCLRKVKLYLQIFEDKTISHCLVLLSCVLLVSYMYMRSVMLRNRGKI